MLNSYYLAQRNIAMYSFKKWKIKASSRIMKRKKNEICYTFWKKKCRGDDCCHFQQQSETQLPIFPKFILQGTLSESCNGRSTTPIHTIPAQTRPHSTPVFQPTLFGIYLNCASSYNRQEKESNLSSSKKKRD